MYKKYIWIMMQGTGSITFIWLPLRRTLHHYELN
ncbi:hypothetical protein BH10BAC2_BH10BAC2_18030 [soil metagenome]